jgi:hypothetical protein
VTKICAVIAVALLFPGTAAAHLRAGTVAVDHRERITERPAGPFSIGVYQSDRALHLRVDAGHTVVVYGYLGTPLYRVDDQGVAVQAAEGGWALVSHRRSVTWHDLRTSRPSWRVPIAVDGRRATVFGTTSTFRRPAIWIWIAALAAIGIAGLRAAPAVTGSVSSIAAVIVAAAFALDTYASPGTWIAGVDEILFAAAGFGVLRWGPPAGRMPAALWLSLLGAAVGLSKGAAFLHALVLAALPGTMARIVIVIAIGAGIAGATRTCVDYARSERTK